MIEEKVMCVPVDSLAALGIVGEGFQPLGHEVQLYKLLDTAREFRPRSECETDTRYKQIIPYVVCMSRESGLFTYVRAVRGGEPRLHKLRSLGVGGHVSETDAPGGGRRGFLAAVRRELKEEILYEKTDSFLQWIGFINDNSNDVGRVHLGVVGVLYVRRGPILVATDHFEECKSLTYTETQSIKDWESWSKFVCDFILGRSNVWAMRG